MYKSPIEIISNEMRMKMDGEILKAVQDVGIIVDKDELAKALAYDRNQYFKGYDDGYKEGYAKAVEEAIERLRFFIGG